MVRGYSLSRSVCNYAQVITHTGAFLQSGFVIYIPIFLYGSDTLTRNGIEETEQSVPIKYIIV
jgi:hypothetical protein